VKRLDRQLPAGLCVQHVQQAGDISNVDFAIMNYAAHFDWRDGAANHITPYISAGREPHAGGLARFREPPKLCQGATAKERMQHRLKTKDGRAIYGQRKQTIEPRFGNIKGVQGFRQFSLRGHENVSGEWQIIGSAYNLKRMHALSLKIARRAKAG
jgi:hypothetical protein